MLRARRPPYRSAAVSELLGALEAKLAADSLHVSALAARLSEALNTCAELQRACASLLRVACRRARRAARGGVRTAAERRRGGGARKGRTSAPE